MRRPVAKVLVFELAGVGLWVAGHHAAAAGFVVLSVAVNAVAQLSIVRDLVPDATRVPQ